MAYLGVTGHDCQISICCTIYVRYLKSTGSYYDLIVLFRDNQIQELKRSFLIIYCLSSVCSFVCLSTIYVVSFLSIYPLMSNQHQGVKGIQVPSNWVNFKQSWLKALYCERKLRLAKESSLLSKSEMKFF